MYSAKPMIESLREHAQKDFDRNHKTIASTIVVNGTVAVHVGTNEPCALNPCASALRVQALKENYHGIS